MVRLKASDRFGTRILKRILAQRRHRYKQYSQQKHFRQKHGQQGAGFRWNIIPDRRLRQDGSKHRIYDQQIFGSQDNTVDPQRKDGRTQHGNCSPGHFGKRLIFGKQTGGFYGKDRILITVQPPQTCRHDDTRIICRQKQFIRQQQRIQKSVGTEFIRI